MKIIVEPLNSRAMFRLTFTMTRALRADRMLEHELPFIRRAQLQKIFRKKDVKVADRTLHADEMVAAGTSVTAFLPDPHAHFCQLTGCATIAEDDNLIVWDKAAGVPTVEGATTGGSSLKSAAERLLGRPFTAVHRLDQQTSGIIVFAKNGRMARRLEDAFRARQTKKIYHAVVAQKPEKNEGIVSLPLKKTNRKVVVDTKSGLTAETAWRIVEKVPAGWLVECTPTTGRTHQIRVHLASIGCPIVGDELYGTREKTYRRHLLHASSLTIIGRTFEAALPAEFRA